MNQNYQRIAIWAAMLVLVLALWNLVFQHNAARAATDIAYSEFLEAVDKDAVGEVRSGSPAGQEYHRHLSRGRRHGKEFHHVRPG